MGRTDVNGELSKNGEKLTLVHYVCSTPYDVEFSPSRSGILKYSAPFQSLKDVSLPKSRIDLYKNNTFSPLFTTSPRKKLAFEPYCVKRMLCCSCHPFVWERIKNKAAGHEVL